MSYETVLLPKWLSHQGRILAKEQFHNSYTFWARPILIFSPVQIIISHPLTLLEMLLLYVNVFNENVTKNASFFSFSFSLQLGSYAQHRSTIYFWFSTVSWILLFTVVSTRNSNSSFFNIKKKTNKTTAVPNKINKFLAEMRSLNSETLPGWLGSFKPTLITIQVSLPKNQHWYIVTKIVLTYCEKKLF